MSASAGVAFVTSTGRSRVRTGARKSARVHDLPLFVLLAARLAAMSRN
ncbi:MAG TPA: hypothetical protein VF059_06930 [Casimicrobiaceae bacterium]